MSYYQDIFGVGIRYGTRNGTKDGQFHHRNGWRARKSDRFESVHIKHCVLACVAVKMSSLIVREVSGSFFLRELVTCFIAAVWMNMSLRFGFIIRCISFLRQISDYWKRLNRSFFTYSPFSCLRRWILPPVKRSNSQIHRHLVEHRCRLRTEACLALRQIRRNRFTARNLLPLFIAVAALRLLLYGVWSILLC